MQIWIEPDLRETLVSGECTAYAGVLKDEPGDSERSAEEAEDKD